MSTMKEFVMTLAATTVSIVLTFGTTAVVDRHKKNAEKREMVMMVMYDMRKTLQEMETCNRDLDAFFKRHVEVVAQPEAFYRQYSELATCVPVFEFTTTTESIFKSNIETIKTIGNILFVEATSSFYEDRSNYQDKVILAFQEEAGVAMESYENLYHFNSAGYPFYAQSYLARMKGAFEQCKVLMKVKDEELEVFSKEHQKLMDITKSGIADENAARLDQLQQRNEALFQARQQGKEKL